MATDALGAKKFKKLAKALDKKTDSPNKVVTQKGGPDNSSGASGKNSKKNSQSEGTKSESATGTSDSATSKKSEVKDGGCQGGSCDGVGNKQCFVAGTLIHTIDGLKPIEAIKKGDQVASRESHDSENTWKPVVKLIHNTDKPVIRLTLLDKMGSVRAIGTTAEHPFWVRGKQWVEAGDLIAGDELVSLTGDSLIVKGVVAEKARQDTYNFEVADYHTYFVDELGVWVHNADCGGVAKGGDTTVGRWMSKTEHKQMLDTRKVVESRTGTTHVADPADASVFLKQAKPGSRYVEFDVPTSSLKQTNADWSKVIGPNSLEGRQAARKGLPTPQMPGAKNIIHKANKLK